MQWKLVSFKLLSLFFFLCLPQLILVSIARISTDFLDSSLSVLTIPFNLFYTLFLSLSLTRNSVAIQLNILLCFERNVIHYKKLLFSVDLSSVDFLLRGLNKNLVCVSFFFACCPLCPMSTLTSMLKSKYRF